MDADTIFVVIIWILIAIFAVLGLAVNIAECYFVGREKADRGPLKDTRNFIRSIVTNEEEDNNNNNNNNNIAHGLNEDNNTNFIRYNDLVNDEERQNCDASTSTNKKAYYHGNSSSDKNTSKFF